MDFKAYLASSSDEDSDREMEEPGNEKENQDSKIAKYKVKSVALFFKTIRGQKSAN